VAVWPGEQRQLDRWLNIGLIDVAFCYMPPSGEHFSSRVLFDDELLMVSTDPATTAVPDSSYIYVDHGDEFRRQHAAAFPGDTTWAITLASSDWAVNHLLRRGGSGYLPRRHVSHYVANGEFHEVVTAPRFRRRIYLVESLQVVQAWDWYEAAVESLKTEK
jgi:hypothetical protein